VITQVCAFRDLKRELIRGYVEGKSAQLILRGPAGHYAVVLSSCSLPRWVRLQVNQIKAIDA
jgi:hypothetical protein